MDSVIITPNAFDPLDTAAIFQKSALSAGAIASFTGFVRDEGGTVKRLRLTHYPGMTEAEIEGLVKRAFARWNLLACHVTHRVGEIGRDEAIVFVAAASAHRRAAFEAVDFLMDYLKSEAPLWKQEIDSIGEAKWIEPKYNDRRDLERWRQ